VVRPLEQQRPIAAGHHADRRRHYPVIVTRVLPAQLTFVTPEGLREILVLVVPA